MKTTRNPLCQLGWQVFLLAAGCLSASAEEWSLDRALGHVGREAPDARIAALRYEKARAQLAEAKSHWLPRATVETGYAVTDNPTQAFMFLLNQRQLTFGGDFNDPDVTDNWGSELRLEYPLYLGGARKAGEEAARAGVEAMREDAAVVGSRLKLEVARLYFQILRAREVVKAAGAALESQTSNLTLAKELVDGGKALPTAVLDLETQMAQAESDVAAASAQRDIAIAMLRTLLGLDAGESFSVSDAWVSIDWPGNPIGAPDRAELKALRKREQQAAARVDAERAGRRPTVAAFASGRYDEGFTEPDGGNSWMAGVTVRMRLFDGGETAAKVDQAEADKAMIGEEIRKQRQQIDLEIRMAQLNLTTARKRVELARKAITSAEESLELTRARFAEGLVLSTQLIDAETALTGTRMRLAAARSEEQIALAELRHALGLPIRNLSRGSSK